MKMIRSALVVMNDDYDQRELFEIAQTDIDFLRSAVTAELAYSTSTEKQVEEKPEAEKNWHRNTAENSQGSSINCRNQEKLQTENRGIFSAGG